MTSKLKEFETGEYLSWFVTSQAANKATITLRDDKTQYFSESKDTTNIEPPLAVGSNRYVGKNLVLEISIPQSDEIRPLPAMHTIISDTGKVLGHSFTCCGEDWSDNDYNDFYINLVGWKSKKRFVTVTRYICPSFPIIHTVINNSPSYTVHRQNPASQAFYCL